MRPSDAQIAGRFTHEQMLSTLMTLFGGKSGAAVGDGGAVWGDFVHGGAEDERDWHPHGTGRGSQRGGGDDPSQQLLQTLLGLAIGIPVAFYGVTLVKSQLYELTTVSSSALAVAVGILLAAACVAGVIPGAAGGVSGSGAGAWR